jgi:predicted anti-sigma-YlaC factor YlaD
MTEHVTQWLEAYHDGELSDHRRGEVEAHLAACPHCQAALDELRSLSALLAEDVAVEFVPAETFAANLALSLPVQPQRRLSAAWWLMPLALLAAWLFLVITLWLSAALQLASSAALPAVELGSKSLQMGWFALTTRLFGAMLGEPGWQMLAALNEINLFVAGLGRAILPQILLATAYLGWLAAWWLRRKPQVVIEP